MLVGCSPREAAPNIEPAPTPQPQQSIRLQMDWYPQAEHGGFYQALAKGFYAESGLDVEILPGGPGAFIAQKLATGRVDVAIGRSDDVFTAVQEGLPLVIIGVFMQRDPLCLLLHEDDPVQDFADLNGRAVMAHPGAAWVRYVEARHGISINLVPMNYGLARFLSDPSFIQQGYVTNEAFVVRRAGARVRTMLIADSGNESLRVIITHRAFLRENEPALRRFVAQSLRGWQDFLHGNAEPARALIRARNERLDDAIFSHALEAMRTERLVDGDPERHEAPGLMSRARLQRQLDQLRDLKLIRSDFQLDEAVSFALQTTEDHPTTGEARKVGRERRY
jgi:NitT/TauT family transport system substrate-binding protein